MHTGEISFCDKTAYNIKSDDTKRTILQRIEAIYGIKIIHKHYDKYDEMCISRLVNNPHLVCVRSNGNPYYLLLTTYNHIQCCIFIDKKVQQGYSLPRMIIVQLGMHDTLFQDTIIDGEMVKTKTDKWLFVCNDLVVYKGQHLLNVNLPKRINMLYAMLENEYKAQTYDLFALAVKTYFKYGDLHKITGSYIQELPYTCRGIYFRPLFIRFKDTLLNFNDDLIVKVERTKYKDVKPFMLLESKEELVKEKAKEQEEKKPCLSLHLGHHRVFQVRKTSQPDVYEIFDANYMGTACIPTLKLSKYMREKTKDMNMIDKLSLPFEYNTMFNKWTPVVG